MQIENSNIHVLVYVLVTNARKLNCVEWAQLTVYRYRVAERN